jgi:hypothetical protein
MRQIGVDGVRALQSALQSTKECCQVSDLEHLGYRYPDDLIEPEIEGPRSTRRKRGRRPSEPHVAPERERQPRQEDEHPDKHPSGDTGERAENVTKPVSSLSESRLNIDAGAAHGFKADAEPKERDDHKRPHPDVAEQVHEPRRLRG